jgi:hypothetical protein
VAVASTQNVLGVAAVFSTVTAMLQASNTRETREAAREIKFLVTPALAADILEWSRPRLAADPHASGESGDEYRTTTLYYDTDAFAVYDRVGSYGRSKYRIRRYGAADVVFLERKLRSSGMLNKRRTAVPLGDLRCLDAPEADAAWAGHWFRRRLETRTLNPVCRVSYRRHARVGLATYGPMRLTLDDQIVALPTQDLSFGPGSGVPVLTTHTIVEMKYRVELPAVLKHLVEVFTLEATSVSKYRLSVDALSLTTEGAASA